MNATETVKIDHDTYMKKVKTMPSSALHYTIADCRAAIEANPEGQKVGYYTDEIHYCTMEIKARICNGGRN